MTNSDITQSHWRELVAREIYDEPKAAEALVRLFVLADSSTPKGAAIRTDLIKFFYGLTDDCRESMERFLAA